MLPQELAHPRQNQHALRDPGHQAALALLLLLLRIPSTTVLSVNLRSFLRSRGNLLYRQASTQGTCWKQCYQDDNSRAVHLHLSQSMRPDCLCRRLLPRKLLQLSGPPPPTPAPAEPHSRVAPAFSRSVYPTQVVLCTAPTPNGGLRVTLEIPPSWP